MTKPLAKFVSIQVRISPKLHKKLKGDARRHNMSLNSTMAHLLQEQFKSRIPSNFAHLSGPTWGTGKSALEQLLRLRIREELAE